MLVIKIKPVKCEGQVILNTEKQECIPIGCVQPACWPYLIVSYLLWREGALPNPLDAHPLEADSHSQVTSDAWWEANPPPSWTEWNTGVKTLPCPKLRLQAVKMHLWIFLVIRRQPVFGWKYSCFPERSSLKAAHFCIFKRCHFFFDVWKVWTQHNAEIGPNWHQKYHQLQQQQVVKIRNLSDQTFFISIARPGRTKSVTIH